VTSSDGRRTTPLTVVAAGSATRNSSSISAKSSRGGPLDVEPKRSPTSLQTLRPAPATRPAGILTHWSRRRRDRGVGLASCGGGSGAAPRGSPGGGGAGGGGGGGGGGAGEAMFAISGAG